jgi:nitrogen fixation/metabolism regulation signal transduction histidine kinase
MITPTRGLSKPLLIEQGRLLVVDDNVDYLRTLELLLDGTGFECEYYDNGPLAIEAARRDEFDVLLVDVRMTPLDGVETARGVKAIQPLLAVVMMTGFDKEDTPLEALRLGAVDYIDKPITNAGAFMRMLAQQVRAVRSSKELRTTKERLETVIENVDAGVVVLDAEGRIEDINQAAADLIAPGEQPLVGRMFREMCGVPELAFPLPAEGSVTKTFEHSAGRQRRLFQVAATRLTGAGARPAGSVLLIKDLTALADSQKAEGWRQMSRAITHGMKTPLATLRMRLERLKSKPDCQPLQAEMDTLLRVVEELHARLRDLVDFVKLEISPTESDLNDTVAAAIRHFEPHRRATTRIEFEPASTPLRLPHSQAAIELALENLLANGQESTTDAVTLRVECAWDAAARQAVVQVSDNGPGIPAEAREDLFRRPVNSTKAGGSGLGAALVKYIVDQHRGSMTWQSPLADGRGTRVTLRLPTESGAA